MEIPSSEETVFQLYAIINNSSNIIVENQEPQENYFEEAEDDNQIVYVALRQSEEEEETITSDMLLNGEDSDTLPQPISNVKLVTLDDGQVYLTMGNSLDDNLTTVQPHLLSSIGEETTSMDGFQLTSREQLEESSDASSSFREIQLEDGTCALINATLWNSLVESTPAVEPETTKKKKFPCLYVGCGKAFTTAHHLAVHTRSHTGNRPYVCTTEDCDKAFATGYSLKAHLRTHTGEKPYGCSVCIKHFKTSGDLQKHMRTHTGEKPFKCPIEGCDKSFTTSNIRKVHIRSHTGERPYTCRFTDCGKAFASATNYKNHMRIHSGEKPYVCSVEGCRKRFTEYSSLYKHNAVHQPYRNYRCDYCAQYFKFENTLKLHKKTVHSVIITENGTEFVVSEDDAKSIILEVTDANDLKSNTNSFLLSSESTLKEEHNL